MTRQRLLPTQAAEDLPTAARADLDSEGPRDPQRRMVAAPARLLTPERLGLMTSPDDEGHQTAGRTG